MFISISSTQSSLWGWKQRPLPATGISAPTSNPTITFTNYTYSPKYAGNDVNRLYAIATSPGTNPRIMMLTPGTCNSGKVNYSQASGELISPNGSTRANFPAGHTYAKAGILGQDGKIYFIPWIGSNICILTPNANSASVSWTFFDLAPGYGPILAFPRLAGGILGKDGKIYIIPFLGQGGGGSRFVTPLTRLNISSGTPTVEMSYYTGTSAATGLSGNAFSSSNSRVKSLSFLGYNNINPVGSDTVNCSSSLSEGPFFSNQMIFGNASYTGNTSMDYYFSLDPYSNKIYVNSLHGTWLFYIDPNNWGNADCLYSTVGLWLKNLISGGQGYRSSNSITGCANNGFKFSSIIPGLNRKLYITISNAYNDNTSGADTRRAIPDNLKYHIQLNTTNNTTSLIQTGINSNMTSGTYSGAAMLPNGVIFGVPNRNYPTYTAGPTKNAFEILTKDSNNIKVIADKTITTPSVINDKKCAIDVTSSETKSYSGGMFGGVAADAIGFPGPTFITLPDSNKRGKIIISGSNKVYGMEVMSIKNFYEDVTNFDLRNTLDIDNSINLLEPPADLANLPTSDYNLYVNRPR